MSIRGEPETEESRHDLEQRLADGSIVARPAPVSATADDYPPTDKATIEPSFVGPVYPPVPEPGTTFATVSAGGVPITVLVETAPSPNGWVDYTWFSPSGCDHKSMAPWEWVAQWYADRLEP